MSVSLQKLLNPVSTQTTTTLSTFTFPEAQQASVVAEIQGELEVEKTEMGNSISYAETTKVFVDETAREALQQCGQKKIKSWAGKELQRVLSGKQKTIPIRDARLINQKAGAQIIKLNAENIDRFTIDPIVRERLRRLPNLTHVSTELGRPPAELEWFNTGAIQTVKKEIAEIYNKYFQKEYQTEMFDSERIFQLALTEPISEKENKLSEHTWIAIEDEHRKKLISLPDRKELRRWVGSKFSGIRQLVRTISVKDAVLIHKISGKIIFTFNKEAVTKIPVLPAHLDELNSLSQKFDAKIRTKITDIKKQKQRRIGREFAERINSRAGKEVFDFESILAQAVQEAEDDVEGMEFSPLSKKRPRSDSTDSTGDSDLLNSKKQRTVKETDRAITAGTPDYEAALSLLMLPVPGESNVELNVSQSHLTPPSSSIQYTWHFVNSLTAPFMT